VFRWTHTLLRIHTWDRV